MAGAEPPGGGDVGAVPHKRFIDILTPQSARDGFLAWRSARHGKRLPDLFDFAPLRLPRSVLPWSMVYRRLDSGELVYGLVGDELVYCFGENPKGKPVLAYAEPAERARRLEIILRSIATGLPVWFVGSVLFERKGHVPVGRLLMPVEEHGREAALIIYFILDEPPKEHLRIVRPTSMDPLQLVWCTQQDLEE